MSNEFSFEVLAALKPDAIRRSDSKLIQSYQKLLGSLEKEAEEAFLGELDSGERARKQKKYLKVSSWRIREDLHPLAYDGDPMRARVLYLTANPSYGENASNESHYQPSPDWPLSVANPSIHPPTAKYYQGTVFSHLLRAGVKPAQISLKMLKVEFSPWASRGFPENGMLLNMLANLPSNRATARLVASLVDQADVVIVKQAAKHWRAAVPRLAELEGKTVFVSRAPVAAYISENVYGKEAWDLLVKILRS